MKQKLKIALITLVILAVVASIVFVSVVAVYTAPWILLTAIAWSSPAPPKPEVTYGEFPFKLVYEIDGEVTTIEDTLIIEYAGVVYTPGGFTKQHKWNWSYMSQKGTDAQDLKYDPFTIFSGTRNGHSGTITFKIGSSEYLMGMIEYDQFYKDYGITPGNFYINSYAYSGGASDDDLYNKYRIKIIEKQVPAPLPMQQ